jgi:hypothetical protein
MESKCHNRKSRLINLFGIIKIAKKPEDITKVVAGRDGDHSALIGTFNSSRVIAKKIK